MDFSFFNTNKVVPVVVLSSIDETIPKLSALKRGGINVAEITFRTSCAPDCLALAVKTFPDMLVGVGTIINREQCVKAIDLGAKFVVSPGFSKEVAEECISRDVPYIPGVITPTEVMMAKAVNILRFMLNIYDTNLLLYAIYVITAIVLLFKYNIGNVLRFSVKIRNIYCYSIFCLCYFTPYIFHGYDIYFGQVHSFYCDCWFMHIYSNKKNQNCFIFNRIYKFSI